ncbi:hypothetical protein CC1G_01527 [Coprinopsis cinerea okayama7|uniref:DUF6534 domain-containing protein n=1 Tax=Coprinopsis cinerea (strain Okayama-7 / 130 / ATCC MYA-4618 / FGSC 9003) TaxID=240176 RepID=A8NHX4_COPC7|nr:hypothetical protein CC1G_01527 [Coprinopsis cinerea okayama7\|eukprot:XP_001833850.1 hypothetical protein CC1G_01527 [Coprinopsis cinerea okayama7\
MAPALKSLVEPTLDNTVGAAFLGVVGAGFLFGGTTLQLVRYYTSYPNDTRLHKVSVGVLWTLDAFHFALAIHSVYMYAVTGFGNRLGLMKIQWSIQLQVAINVIIIVMVHSLYAHRVWKLSGYHRGVLGYITILVVAGAAGIGIVLAYKVFTVKLYSELDGIAWIITAGLGTSTAIDFFITAAMCYYLRKSLGNGPRLNSRISVVTQYTLSSGLLTSACSLSTMFCYILLPNTFVFLGLEFLLTKFYVGSFLAMLNARERTQNELTSPTSEKDSHLTSMPTFRKKYTSSFWSPPPLSPVPQISEPMPIRAPIKWHVYSPSEETKVGIAV